MQQAHHVVLTRKLLHKLHGYLVVVGRDIGCRIDRRKLVLGRRDLVMLGFRKNAELPQLLVKLFHERGNARLYRPVIMIIQLLALGRLRAEERSAGVHYILALFINAFVDEEIFLLRADGGLDRGHIIVAEKLQHTQSLTVESLHRAQKRRFLIQCLAAVGAKRCRYAKDVILYKRIRGRVPRSVAARFKRCAQSSRREARRIRLALNKLLAGKLHDYSAVIAG